MKVWQRLPNGEYYTWLTVDNNLIGVFVDGDYEYAYCDLPDDVRLCQLVDAPPVIPPEVAETVREELLERRKRLEYTVETYEMVKRLSIGEVAIKDKAKARIIAIEAALSWLDSVMEADNASRIK